MRQNRAPISHIPPRAATRHRRYVCLLAITLLALLLINTASADRLTSLALDLTEPESNQTTRQTTPTAQTPDDERTLLPPTASLRDDLRPLGNPQAPEAEPLPEAASQTSYWWLLETAGALGVVIGLIFAARWAYQKLSGHQSVAARPTADVEVLSRTTVAPRSQVLLLRVGQRVLVCSDTGQALNCLSEITQPEEVAAILGRTSNASSAGFNEVLQQLETEPDDLPDNQPQPIDRAREDLSQLLSRVRNASASRTQANDTPTNNAANAGMKTAGGLRAAGAVSGAGGWVG